MAYQYINTDKKLHASILIILMHIMGHVILLNDYDKTTKERILDNCNTKCIWTNNTELKTFKPNCSLYITAIRRSTCRVWWFRTLITFVVFAFKVRPRKELTNSADKRLQRKINIAILSNVPGHKESVSVGFCCKWHPVNKNRRSTWDCRLATAI